MNTHVGSQSYKEKMHSSFVDSKTVYSGFPKGCVNGERSVFGSWIAAINSIGASVGANANAGPFSSVNKLDDL